jgi:hypothetical protein
MARGNSVILATRAVSRPSRRRRPFSLSDKYAAGFLDGDGSILIENNPVKRLVLAFHQKELNSGVIDLLFQRLPGGIRDDRSGRRNSTVTHAARLRFTGRKAIDILCRLKPHLVAKRVRTNHILSELGSIERVGTDNSPVYPDRKWLAGYFDADGCIYAGVNRHGGSASVQLSIDSDGLEKDGLVLAQKAFGGVIRQRGKTGNCWRWELKASPALVCKFFEPIAQHLLVKREQAYFILGCAKMGHFRDGKIIADTLKAMKTHPHRLNDLAATVNVSAQLALVRGVPSQGRYRHAEGVLCSCGRKPYAHGLCSRCYQNMRYHAKMDSAAAPFRGRRRLKRQRSCG